MRCSAFAASVLLALSWACCSGERSGDGDQGSQTPIETYQAAQWDPIHFAPAIDGASNEDCLRCHREILERRVRARTERGLAASSLKTWYQELITYEGEQETFHRRHLVTPLATKLMRLRCNTCHRGNDPREEASPQAPGQFTLRKLVNPETCLMCHGQMNFPVMALPGPWPEVRDAFQNNCLTCHLGIRTVRHQVNFLDAEAIEAAATEVGGDVCFGCHGGRAWYQTKYPYPRHAWPGMPPAVPDWAAERPAESEPRFRTAIGGEGS